MSNDEDNLERIGKAMQKAWTSIKGAQARSWGQWVTIGEGLFEGRRWAMKRAGTDEPKGKGYILAFGEWLKRFKVNDMDPSDRAKLLIIMEERIAIEEWRAGLTDSERRSLNNPTSVWRKWNADTKVKKKKSSNANVSGAEHRRAKDIIEEQAARIEEQAQELINARAPIDLETCDVIPMLRDLCFRIVNENVAVGLDVMVADIVARAMELSPPDGDRELVISGLDTTIELIVEVRKRLADLNAEKKAWKRAAKAVLDQRKEILAP
jgi:hypothetical protein